MGLSSKKLPPGKRNEVADAVLAKPLDVAKKYLKEQDIEYRVFGNGQMGVNNFVIDRANLLVQNNVVTQLTWG